jgi:ketosteroid isomerase-like protein
MVDHPNVALLRHGFEALASGDLDTVLDMYSPDLKWHGGDEFGIPTDFDSRDDFFGMFMRSFEIFDESTMELVDAIPVGDSLVTAHVRAHRRTRDTQQVADFDFVMSFRVVNGKVTHGADLLDGDTEDYFAALKG